MRPPRPCPHLQKAQLRALRLQALQRPLVTMFCLLYLSQLGKQEA